MRAWGGYESVDRDSNSGTSFVRRQGLFDLIYLKCSGAWGWAGLLLVVPMVQIARF